MVNANNGNITKWKTEPVVLEQGIQGVIDSDRAKAIVLDTVGDGIVTKCHLKYKQKTGAWIYDVRVVRGDMKHKVDLNAMTGSIIKHNSKYEPQTR